MGGTFKLQQIGNRWVVPTEALEVEMQYGGTVGLWLTGVTEVELEVRGGDRVDHFSTKDGIGSPCLLGAVIAGLGTSVAFDSRYTVPPLKEEWWTEGEVTLWAGEQWARFNILDGWLLSASDPPPAFLSQLVAPSKAPRITSIRWVEGTAIVTVAVADETKIVLEFSEDFRKWVTVDPPTVSKTSAGSRTLSHTPPPEATCGFYRILVPPPPALKGTP